MAATGALAVGAISSAATAYSQAQAYEAQGYYQKKMSKINASFAEMEAEDAIKRGDREAGDVRRRGKKIHGAQRAALAAQGIDIDSGSALDIQDEARSMTEQDALTVRNNAWREAWGYRVQASNATAEGRMAQLTARGNARNTLLTGGLQATSYGLQAYSAYQKRGS